MTAIASPDSPIVFGTDGWRARIDDPNPSAAFNEANVVSVIQALAAYWKQNHMIGTAPIIGYDRRRDSEKMARVVAEVLAANGFPPLLASRYCPTPTVSWMVKDRRAIGGVVITASHNPWMWNGVKFKEAYGGSASPEYTKAVEALIQAGHGQSMKRDVDEPIETFDPHDAYLAQLARLIDLPKIKKSGVTVLYDSLYGAGSGYLSALLGDQIVPLHHEADFRFGGLNPEPIAANLGALMDGVKKGGYAMGLATDGDADRIGAVDERGHYVSTHQIFALILRYLVEKRGMRGPVIKSVSVTKMLDVMGAAYGIPIHETPIGFKHICKKLVETEAMLGGEESGGIGFGPHVYERDGLLNGLFLLEMCAVYGKPLSELVRDLERDFGAFAYDRLDIHLKDGDTARLRETLSRAFPQTVAGKTVERVQTIDGVKLHFTDRAWLLFRLSGTEPLLRIYAEAESDVAVNRLLAEACAFLSIDPAAA